MGALEIWQQMKDKPKFYQAWQALMQSYDLMMHSDYINRLYAYNALEFFFNDYASV